MRFSASRHYSDRDAWRKWRYQQQYQEYLRQQQLHLQNQRYNDQYYYSAPNYRYSRSGRYYETNEYGAELLRQAVNYGYEQGFRAGQADREDSWGANYQDSYAYQDAFYGYNGYYVDSDQYRHYFPRRLPQRLRGRILRALAVWPLLRGHGLYTDHHTAADTEPPALLKRAITRSALKIKQLRATPSAARNCFIFM